jgi:cyclopropane-fatty-acyl-phospholipid synthase
MCADPDVYRRVTSWLKPGGKLFVHIFCHKFLAYNFETVMLSK